MISVIIPVYNVEKYISQCLDSVCNQTYTDLEIILVDDGSTDESGKICDEYAQRDSRIKVIHQSNGGAAAAKNAGLLSATGKYLSFVDSDDFLEPGAYWHMLQIIQEWGADVVQCSYRDVFQDHTVERFLQIEKKVLSETEFLTLFTKDWTCGLMTDKLYERSIFKGIFFETGHKIDDEYFTYRGIMNAKKIVRDSQIVYNYRKRASSVMYSPAFAQQIISDRIDYLSKRRKNVIARFPQLRAVFDSHFLEMMIILSRDTYVSEAQLREIRQQLGSYFREKNHTMPNYRLLPALIALMFYRPETLLCKRKPAQPVTSPDSFFE